MKSLVGVEAGAYFTFHELSSCTYEIKKYKTGVIIHHSKNNLVTIEVIEGVNRKYRESFCLSDVDLISKNNRMVM